jgi:hypothetical protein
VNAAMRATVAEPHRRKRFRCLRRRCERHIRELELPTPCDVPTLCKTLENKQNRPITLVPLAMPAWYPCGMLVAAETEDIIFYDTNTTSAHQEHIIMHELGHIICGHHGEGLPDANARLLFPNLDPEIVRDMLMRTTYDDVQEQEAEIVAHLLAERFDDSLRPADKESATEESVIGRIERTLL